MVSLSDVGWGSYNGYEGALLYGKSKFQLPANPSEEDRLVYLLSQTESGALDSVNAYDRCVVSVGLFQFCEGSYFLSSKLLGAILEKSPHLISHLDPALTASNAEFRRNVNGKWRFFFLDARGEVDTITEQRQLFLLHSNGLKGTWDEASKAHVKLWVACLANFLQQPEGFEAHVKFTASQMLGFVMPEAKAVLFPEGLPSTGWMGAMKAIYLSFAGNLPAVANQHLQIALKTAPGEKWTKDWSIHIIRQLTFGPQIAIWPGRYEKIRPLVEKFYGVDLPDFAKDLQAWKTAMGPIAEGEPSFTKAEEIQEVLIGLGFDLGPKGADGKMGGKTQSALLTFQRQNGLVPDGQVGPKTKAKLLEAWLRSQ